jgi:hypothetical protein
MPPPFESTAAPVKINLLRYGLIVLDLRQADGARTSPFRDGDGIDLRTPTMTRAAARRLFTVLLPRALIGSRPDGQA